MQWRQQLLRDLPWLLIIVAVAVALRTAWIIRADTFPVQGLDTFFYDQTARRLADGLGYTHYLDGIATALFPPGYPFALAGVYKVFGASIAIGQAFNVLVSVAVVLATYTLGRLAIGRAAALLGAFLWAVFPSQVIWSSLLMSELVFMLALVLSLALVFASMRATSTRGQVAAIVAAGAFAGAATLIRGQGIGLWWVVALWLVLLRQPGALRTIVLYTFAMALVLVPWTARNARVFDAPVLISNNAGYNAVIGHSDYADGGFWSPASRGVFDDYILIRNPAGEVERNKAGTRMAIDWALSHPKEEIVLAFKKTAILWGEDADALWWQEAGVPAFMTSGERRGLTILVNLFYYGILVAGGVGLVLAFRRSEPWAGLVLLIILYWTVFHIGFFAESRFHYPLSPLMSLAAAVGLIEIAQRLRVRFGYARIFPPDLQ